MGIATVALIDTDCDPDDVDLPIPGNDDGIGSIEVIIRYLTGERLFRLEYGEAHVAIRAGMAPDQPDNVVQPFVSQRMGLYASRDYVAEFGMPGAIEDYGKHRFVGHDNDDSRAPFNRWLRQKVPQAALTFRSSDVRALEQAVIAGAGIGFMPVMEAQEREDLVEVFPHQEDWSAPLWLVTHVDLHRTTKVQAFLSYLKEQSRDWQA